MLWEALSVRETISMEESALQIQYSYNTIQYEVLPSSYLVFFIHSEPGSFPSKLGSYFPPL